MLIQSEKELDEFMEVLKQDLKAALEDGEVGIIINRSTNQIPPYNQLSFTFDQGGVKFEGCIYDSQIIGAVLSTLSTPKEKSIPEQVAEIKKAAEALGLLGIKSS